MQETPDSVAPDLPPALPPELPQPQESGAAPAAPEEPVPAKPLYAFRFTGAPGEYFRIWIVNLFLTIVTLGLYSPWAKVRKKRYFYAHTWVADANFEYHGNPLAIFKGRMVALVAFMAYSATGHFYPQFAAVVALLMFTAAPWFIARSMAFNAFNSSYRNIRFRFQATYVEVLKAIWPIAVFLVLSLFLPVITPGLQKEIPVRFWLVIGLQMVILAATMPYIVGALQRLHVSHSAFGLAPFTFHAKIRSYYWVYFLAFLQSIPLIFGVFVVLGIVIAVSIGVGPGGPGGAIAAGVLGALGYLLIAAMLSAYTRSRTGNLMYNNSRIDARVSFVSRLGAWRLAWIYLVNLLAISLSLGMAVPWAAVRVQRYRCERLQLEVDAPFDQFAAGVNQVIGATGEELGEFMAIDLSL